MARDELPTVWRAEQHTLAKHRILKSYLDAWLAIMSAQSRKAGPKDSRLLYVDGFAGPGIYENGEPGSPIIAIQSAINHSRTLPVPVEYLFIELDSDRHASLKAELGKLRPQIASAAHLRVREPILGDCAAEVGAMLDAAAPKSPVAPALFFLDQFGYSAVPMSLVRRIMGIARCEVFAYLNWSKLERFITDGTKWPGITAAFGSERWKAALAVAGAERRRMFLEEYIAALRDTGGADEVLVFTMRDAGHQVVNWLFFLTQHPKGLFEMKRAMLRQDASGTFEFCDADDPSQLALLKANDDQALSEELAKKLSGRTMTVDEIFLWTLRQTPCTQFKGALRLLEDRGLVDVVDAPADRRKGTFKDEQMRVRFK